jgi:hypothetical protein
MFRHVLTITSASMTNPMILSLTIEPSLISTVSSWDTQLSPDSWLNLFIYTHISIYVYIYMYTCIYKLIHSNTEWYMNTCVCTLIHSPRMIIDLPHILRHRMSTHEDLEGTSSREKSILNESKGFINIYIYINFIISIYIFIYRWTYLYIFIYI